ncbi:MAG TPA: sigma 54-interacting transcriptional regulator [Thermodesulfobacteriota bacterium]|nr:sigma 54-interacting transcriptional regulator [Deltaproteobacteria bacterium]HNR13155.1 sigma 54-interacting transcriptional regulator [Thermodesulfobacteriota bacterium]HNU71961.1 sigma 54-interacting transcriptional regulator [Thermodesulfobacteriota bacterium]
MSPVQNPEYINSILRGLAIPFFIVDKDFRIVFFNGALEKLTGFKMEETVGKPCHEVVRSNICDGQCALRETMSTGRDIVNMEISILNKKDHSLPVTLTTSVVRDRNGKIIGGMESFRDLTFINSLRREIRTKYTYNNIISKNKKILEVIQNLPDIATSSATVLLHGESGTGKELFANALHDLSPRREKPFVKVNCGALPETLLESELFGYKRGAFTDAKRDKPGRFRLAEGGTLFMDEIGEVAKSIQVKLLRVLEQKEYEPLGGIETEKANVRVIVATNRDLGAMVQNGMFREDLYYRLNVVPIYIPPLRERKEDIPLLVEHFIDVFNHTVEAGINGITSSAMKILLNHGYPGNVRELENIIEHAFVLCRESYITPKNLPDYLIDRFSDRTVKGKKLELVSNYEKELIEETLKQYGGNIKRAAEELGVHRSTLWRKMKKNRIPVRNG